MKVGKLFMKFDISTSQDFWVFVLWAVTVKASGICIDFGAFVRISFDANGETRTCFKLYIVAGHNRTELVWSEWSVYEIKRLRVCEINIYIIYLLQCDYLDVVCLWDMHLCLLRILEHYWCVFRNMFPYNVQSTFHKGCSQREWFPKCGHK